MNTSLKDLEFDVLGLNVRFKPEDENKKVPPKEVVDYVLSECAGLKGRLPQLDTAQLSILAMLQIGQKYLELLNEYKEELERIQSSTKDILSTVEQINL